MAFPLSGAETHEVSLGARSDTPTFIDGKRVYPFVIFTVVMIAVVMSGLDQSIVATALPTLRNNLHARINWAAWTITAYQFGLVMTLPIAGRISDQFGRRRIFLTCVAIFTIFSLLCATAVNIYELLVFRAFQAVGAGAFFPSAVGIITDHFGEDRDRAVGMISATGPVGTLCGPVVGGIIIAYWSWRGVFLINIPIGFVVFYLGLRFIPRSRPVDVPKADLRGTALLAGVLLPLMYGITALGEGTTPIWSPLFIVPELFALFCGFLFVRHSRATAAPVIPLELLNKGGFGRLNLINFLYGGCAIGIGSLIPLYTEVRYHFASLQAGTVLSARAAGALTVAGATAFLIRKIGYRRPMIAGFFVASVGMATLSFSPKGLTPYAWVAVAAAIIGIGNGIAAPSTNNAILHKATGAAGSISGLRSMFRQIGAISMISVSTAVLARSHNEGVALGHIFLFLAIVVTAIVVPISFTVADRRGKW